MGFYQIFWPILKTDFMSILNLLERGTVDFDKLNHALITLVLKKSNSNSISDFRRINLLNCFLKIISKVLANRLAPLVSMLVDVSQYVF